VGANGEKQERERQAALNQALRREVNERNPVPSDCLDAANVLPWAGDYLEVLARTCHRKPPANAASLERSLIRAAE